LPVRAHHLDDTHIMGGEEPMQSCTPCPGAFNTDGVDIAEGS